MYVHYIMVTTKTTRWATSAAKAKKANITEKWLEKKKKTPAKKSPAKKSTRSVDLSGTKDVQPKMPAKVKVLKKLLSTDISKWNHLVIVESPAKAKTISGYLWKHVTVRASYGHVSDLPAKTMWIDIKNDFEPTYEVTPEKRKVIAELKKHVKDADGVWLATDEDREWEAIGWHVAQALWLDVNTTPRIVFHEITKEAIQHAVQNPRTLNMDLVDAQQARRVLDRLVWFSISPVLWTKIKRGLSAWRVQSVAVKLIIEKEREIQWFKPEESWKLFADISYWTHTLQVTLAKIAWKDPKLATYDDVVAACKPYGIAFKDSDVHADEKTGYSIVSQKHSQWFVLQDIVIKQWKKNPAAPFITSSLQQEASRRFGRGVKQVMQVAQRLYESGFITYMRTDSTNLSGLAIGTAKAYITSTYGEKYHQVRQFAGKSKNAQEAHEAIRPSYIDRTPEKSWLSSQELMLYRLIWQRTVASQMASAEVEQTTYQFAPEWIDHIWTIQWEVITFDWFLAIYEKQKSETSDDEEAGNDGDVVLPKIPKNTTCPTSELTWVQYFSKPPSRYTESALVKALESRGIWRPSTYAPTIQTIQDRGYVEKKEDKKLYPLEIAFLVNDYLAEHFKTLMDYEFTANMEQTLDEIAEWQHWWKDMMKNFYVWFDKEIWEAKKWEKAVALVGRECPKCKEWQLIYKFTRFGKFIWCEKYPECDYTEKTKEESDALAPLKEKYEWQPCPEWGTIVVKMGRFWPFLTSSLYPEVKWITSIPDDAKIALEKEHGGKTCPECGKGTLVVKKARRGNYFLACDKYPDCKHAENIPGQPATWGGGKWGGRRFVKKKVTKKK